MIRIFHPVLCYYPSQAGGPANTLYWINSALDKEKFSCDVLATNFGLNSGVSLDLISKKVSSINHNVRFVNSRGLVFFEYAYYSILKCNIVQFSSLFFLSTLPILILAVLYKKKIIISPRGELYPDALQKSKKLKTYYLSILKLFSRYIKFHATNEIECALIEYHFPKNKEIVTIPNYIPVEELRAVNQKYQILFLGRINEIKNIHVLIQAMEILKKDFVSPPKLILAGKAELESENDYLRILKKEISQKGLDNVISFIGQVEGEQKLVLIQESLCTILPSKSENFGNVVLESLMMGTPVIASKGTPWQTLDQKNAGYWIDPAPNEISDRIRRIIEMSESDYQQMRRNARALVLDEFDIKRNINKWSEFYN